MAKIKVQNQTIEIGKTKENAYSVNGKEVLSDLIKTDKNQYHLLLDNKSYLIEILKKDHLNGNLSLKVNGRVFETHHTFKLEELLKSMGLSAGKKKQKDIKAPMPGLVLDILIEPGQEVKEGDDLIILEAMKMENVLKAPHEGVIGQISVEKQSKVDKNQVLLSYE
ncbi:acetyl-CoA carboxylase biotin carboxyl carrier protein subunit [bacterium]|nr:acetyl-CoA carboxylase biotin carboxyl carrier protein subunit [bacterium]